MIGKCSLCFKKRELQNSHILPKFIYSWYKRTSVGAIRTNQNPNLRVQDGKKSYLFCKECESKLNKWETPFCNRIFIPLHNPEPQKEELPYKDWALKFAISVSYRVLLYFKELGLSHLTPHQNELVKQALKTWRSFLLNKCQSVGKFEQHIIPLDVIESHTSPGISPFLNRYFLRTVHMDIISKKNSAIVFSKLFRIIIFGFIEEDGNNWRETEIHAKNGSIGGVKNYLIPGAIGEYMNQKADEVMSLLSEMSEKQKDKISELFNSHFELLIDSEVARAMHYDVLHSGKDAFSDEKDLI